MDIVREMEGTIPVINDIRDFHERFFLRYEGPPRHLPEDMSRFRIRFLQEELEEYIVAVERQDLEKQFDALIDLVYVAMGTAYLHGFPFDKGWNEVQAANMRKVRARREEESKRGTHFDVIKPPDWRGPDLTRILNEAASVWEERNPVAGPREFDASD